MCWNKDEIRAILTNPKGKTIIKTAKGIEVAVNNSLIIYRMLQALYQRQTEDEQDSQVTKYENGVGFNGADSFILTDIAQKSAEYMRKNPKNLWGLSKGQTELVAKKLVKYSRQLEEIASVKKVSRGEEDEAPVQTNQQLPLISAPVQPKKETLPTANVIADRIARMRQEDPETFYQDGMLDDSEAVAVWTNKFNREMGATSAQPW